MPEASTTMRLGAQQCDIDAPPRGQMPHKPAHIYVLKDPIDGEVRYVGVTTQTPKARLIRHLVDARRSKKSHSRHWIKSLIAKGLQPVMEVIEIVPAGPEWCLTERRWIAHFRSIGAKLTNLTDGGDGCPGSSPAPEVRSAISAAKKGWTPSTETRARMSKAAKARGAPPRSTLERAWAGVRRETRSAETAEKARIAGRGREVSPEVRAKISASKLVALPRDLATYARGGTHYKAKAVLMDGLLFPTLEAAAQHAGVTYRAISFRIKKGRAHYATD